MNGQLITLYITNTASVVLFTSLLASSLYQGQAIRVAILSPIAVTAWAMVALWFAEKYLGYTHN